MSNYGFTVYAVNARHALLQVAREVLEYGLVVRPRGLLTKEVRHMTVVVGDPRDWACKDINADWSAKVVAVEALQLIGGFSDPEWATHFVPTLEPYLNDEGGFDGAYGLATDHALPVAVNRLKADPDTRQAIIPIYTPTHTDLENSKDYPCTLSLHFLVRGGALDLDVTMRSNDVNWGLKHDMGQFMLLQCSVADLLGIPVGNYVHTSHSMHLYESSFDWAENLDESGVWNALDVPIGGVGGWRPLLDVYKLMHRAREIAYDFPLSFESGPEQYLRKVLHG